MLVIQGPELIVDIGFDPNYTTGIPAGLAAPGVPALVDTGAIYSFIDDDLANKLGLPIVNQQTVSGSNGQHLVNMYLGHIFVPSLHFTITGQFGGVHLVAGGQRHNAILGRTFLMHFTMTYNGLTGEVELHAP
jgi:predicted aspartyl protease